MAPPGILSIDEHLDDVRSSCKKNVISVPAFSPLSKWSVAPPAKGVTSSIFHDHDYALCQQQQQQQQPTFCESSTDSNSFEEIDIASIDFDDFVSKGVTQMGDATGMDDSSNYGTDNKAPVAVDNSKCHLIGANDACLTENIDGDNTPATWFMDDVDDDFFDGLDDFDLELGEFDPCIDMDTEDPFQRFFEETLNNAATNTICMNDDEYETRDVTDEDTHKKEFFLKLLGLQSVSHTPQNRLSNSPEVCASNKTCYPTLTQAKSPVIKSTDAGAAFGEDFMCQGNNFCVASSAITTHSSSLLSSVPAKMCSCAATDWKNSLLYSTAPVCSNGLVQTNLSTAPTKSTAYNMAAQNFRFTSSSTSLKSADNFEDLPSCSLLGGDELQLKNQSDADAFLQWLEEDGETASSTQAFTEMPERSTSCASYKSMSAQPKVNDANCVSESNPLSVGHSIPDTDMDSFIDLESYAMEKSPSSIPSGKDTHHHSNYLSNHPGDKEFDPEEILGCVESKYKPSSELRFRLSLLDDYSCRKDRYLEKKDTSCQFGVNGLCVKRDTFDDPLADFTSDAASSPLSPYSSSSVHSSYGQPKGAEDRLDLLELFSEENSFLLMEHTDSRYGFS